MKRSFRTMFAALALALSLTALMLAPTSVHPVAAISLEPEAQAEPRAFTTLNLSIDGGNGEVYATVKNTFTLFPSTVEVVVYLYNSAEPAYAIAEMKKVKSVRCPDLNMGDMIKMTAPTNGETLYWAARVEYKSNNDAWRSLETKIYLFDGNGNLIS